MVERLFYALNRERGECTMTDYGYEALPIKRYNFQNINKMSKENKTLDKQKNGNDFIADVSSRFYQIDFGNHLRCKLKITDGKIEVEGAINGWGDGVPLEQVVILE